MAGLSAGSTLAVVSMVRLRERGIRAFSGAVLQSELFFDLAFVSVVSFAAVNRHHELTKGTSATGS